MDDDVVQVAGVKPTINDIARHAGVSLATVDRVLNDRPGVRSATIERVNDAVQHLGYVRDTAAANLARQRVYQFLFLLPDSQGGYFDHLQAHVDGQKMQFANERTHIRSERVSTLHSTEIAAALDALTTDTTDGVALVAPETPTVRDAVARARARGIRIVALLTDLPSSPRDHFVGIDDVKAGRTAATLMGRFTLGSRTDGAKILVVTDSRFSRSFLERRYGFDASIAQHFPHLSVLPTCVLGNNKADTETILQGIFRRCPEIAGIYSATPNNDGLIRYLQSNSHELSVIAHELTPSSRSALESNCLDAVISQDATHIVGSAVRLMRSSVDGVPFNALREHSRIEIYLSENLPER